MKNVKFTNKSYRSLNSWKTDYALVGSSLLRLDNSACLNIREMHTLRDKHSVQKGKNANLIYFLHVN